MKQLSPFGGGGGEAPRGRRMSSNAGEMDMRSGIRTAMGEVEGRSAGRGRTLPMSRDRAQMVVAFLMIALVGMNDSATGANVRRSKVERGERELMRGSLPVEFDAKSLRRDLRPDLYCLLGERGWVSVFILS